MKDQKNKINEILDEIRPFLQMDGGDVEFISYQDGIVTVRLTGECEGCPLIDVTLKNAIEESLKNEIPEIKEVRKIS